MDNEIQLIADGDGIAVIGEPSAVERFLISEGLPSRDLGLERLRPVLGVAAEVTKASSEIAANSGRWVKLTKESAQALKTHAMMSGSKSGLVRGAFTEKGKIKGLLEFAKPGSIAANPALLAGAAGLMAQVAMQQAMDEITDYLAVIDEKVDDLLRAQNDAVLADMIGVDFMIEEAMTVREQTGRVSDVTWSKVQGTSVTVARTQSYALRALDTLADKIERRTKIGDLADTSKEVESKVSEWLAVLARCFQLQDGLAVLELDRVLDAFPDELDQHRLGLGAARQNRLDHIARSTDRLMARMDAAAVGAKSKALLHPLAARSVVDSSNHVATGVTVFHETLGIEGRRQSMEAKRWVEAAADVGDKVFQTGAGGVDAVKGLSSATIGRARSVTDKVTIKMAEGALRRRGIVDAGDETLTGGSEEEPAPATDA